MKWLLIFSALLFASNPVWPDDVIPPVQQSRPYQTTQMEVPIAYLRDMPSQVRRSMPPRAKSCFSGSFLLGPGQRYAINLYNPHPAAAPKPGEVVTDGGSKLFVLQVFRYTTVGKARFTFVNAFDVDYTSEELDVVQFPNVFGAELLWLDPEKKTVPVLDLKCYDPHGYCGEIGEYVLVTFLHGFAHEGKVQAFTFGCWKASDSSGMSQSFDKVDQNGFMEIQTRHYHASPDPVHFDDVTQHWHPEDGHWR